MNTLQAHTSFSKWYHDVSGSIKETGKSQRGHITPHLEGSGKGVINQKARHVWRIVKDPAEKSRTTLCFQTYKGQCQKLFLVISMGDLWIPFVCCPLHCKANYGIIMSSTLVVDPFSLLTYRWRCYGPTWGLRQRFCSWPHLEPHIEAVSWPPGWTYPALQSPPTPSASASSSAPWRWTP